MIDPSRMDLATLHPKPLIDGDDHGWTGVIGEHPGLLIGELDLESDGTDETAIPDTRKWKYLGFSARQKRRSRMFHAVARQIGEHVLIHVDTDLESRFTDTGAHQAKRKFTGLLRITGRCDDWTRAEPIKRD